MYKKKKFGPRNRHGQREESHAGLTRIIRFQSKECQGLLATLTSTSKGCLITISWGEERKQDGLADTSVSDFWPPELIDPKTINFCSVKPPRLWAFIMAALGSDDRPSATLSPFLQHSEFSPILRCPPSCTLNFYLSTLVRLKIMQQKANNHLFEAPKKFLGELL